MSFAACGVTPDRGGPAPRDASAERFPSFDAQPFFDARPALDTSDRDRADRFDVIGRDTFVRDVFHRDAIDDVASLATDDTLGAPRPIAPLSGSRTTRTAPTLRWSLADGTVGVRIEICADRDCTRLEQRFDADGSSTTPLEPLLPGVHFWRVYGRTADAIGTHASTTWEFWAPLRDAPTDTSWGAESDFDGDGRPDLAIATQSTPRTFVYLDTETGFPTLPSRGLTVPPHNIGDVDVAGDVNGDGFVDFLLGQAIYFGSRSGIGDRPDIVLTSGASHALDIAAVGDVDGDGYGDLVGALSSEDMPRFMPVYRGGPAGPAATPSQVIANPNVDEYLFGGLNVSAGDVNGDGFGDVIASSPHDGTESAYLFLGSPAGLPRTPSSVIVSRRVFGNFGTWTKCVGDLDGDGRSDLAFGTWGPTVVFYGQPTGIDYAHEITIDVGVTAMLRSATGGDFDGDGFDDLAILAGNGLFVFAGGPTGVPRTVTTATLTDLLSTGTRALSAHDFDGDGLADLAVGEERFRAPDFSISEQGRVRGFAGSPSGLGATAVFTIVSPAVQSFGYQLAD